MLPILVATDGSSGADRAVDTAAELAKATAAPLVIVTVGGNISGAQLRELAAAEGDLSKRLEADANEILERAKQRAARAGASDIKLRSGWGDPSQVIIEAVLEEKADILVIGRRGRGLLSGLLLGSVSQKLASLAPCKVIVVP